MSRSAQGNLYPDDASYAPSFAQVYAQRLTQPETDSDTEMRHDLERALAEAPLDASHLEVCVRDGCAMIVGSIPTIEDEAIAIQRAWSVPGVTDVKSQVLVEH